MTWITDDCGQSRRFMIMPYVGSDRSTRSMRLPETYGDELAGLAAKGADCADRSISFHVP